MIIIIFNFYVITKKYWRILQRQETYLNEKVTES